MPPTNDEQQVAAGEEDLDGLDDGSDFKLTDGDDEDGLQTEAKDETDAKAEKDASGETGSEEDSDEPEVKSKDNRMIPRSRFNEKNEEAKRLAAENAELRRMLDQGGQQGPKDEPNGKADEDALFADLATLTRARKKAIEDDDDEAAIKADRDIAELNAKIVQARLGPLSPPVKQEEITAAAVDQMEWKAGLQQVYKDYPVLNVNSPDADGALIQEVLDMQEALILKGDSKANSLEKAVHYVMGAAGIKPEGEAKPSLEKEPKKRSTAKQAAKKAPAISKAGEVGDDKPVSLADLSDEELEALPESKLAKLRGDFLT